jgi:hypothetical protein
MPSLTAAPCPDNASGLGWVRRVLRQQLDALSRLKAIAWRLMEPPAPASEPAEAEAFTVAAFLARIGKVEKAARLQARGAWALRLINALRVRLLADLEAVENGQLPNLPDEAGGLDRDPEHSAANDTPSLADKKERAERGDRPDRDRFGFEGRGSDRKLAEILKRPTAEIIALICVELGLPADWPRVAEEDWAREPGFAGGAERPPAPRPSPSPRRIRTAPS